MLQRVSNSEVSSTRTAGTSGPDAGVRGMIVGACSGYLIGAAVALDLVGDARFALVAGAPAALVGAGLGLLYGTLVDRS